MWFKAEVGGILLRILIMKPLLLEQIQEAQNVDEELVRDLHAHKRMKPVNLGSMIMAS